MLFRKPYHMVSNRMLTATRLVFVVNIKYHDLCQPSSVLVCIMILLSTTRCLYYRPMCPRSSLDASLIDQFFYTNA